MSGKPFAVAAFHIGKTRSGCALSYEQDSNKDAEDLPMKCTSETSTIILLDPKEQFHSFGTVAENNFVRLSKENMNVGWRLFRYFRINANDWKKSPQDDTVRDTKGDAFPAHSLYTMSIKFLYDRFLEEVKKSGLLESDIQYVITVPDSSIEAKEFIRKAALSAGICTERLTLALETEAAVTWCQEVPTDTNLDNRCMVVDISGQYAQLSVHGFSNVENVTCQWDINRLILKFLDEAFTQDVMEEFQTTALNDYFDVTRDIAKKLNTFLMTSETITFRLPSSLLDILHEHTDTQSWFRKLLSLFNVSKRPLVAGDKLRIGSSDVENWFKMSVDKVVHSIKPLLQKYGNETVIPVFLVGDYAKCQIIPNLIREGVKGIRLIIPAGSDNAHLKGAVMFGRTMVKSNAPRIPHTYGFGWFTTCTQHGPEPGVHKQSATEKDFKIVARRNREIKLGNPQIFEIKHGSCVSGISVFRRDEDNNKWIFCASISVENSEKSAHKDQVKQATFLFKESHMQVILNNKANGKEATHTIEY